MKGHPTESAPAASGATPGTWFARARRAWDRFWFTPADPTLLGLIRICCGLIVVYCCVTYSFELQDFFGRDAWYNLPLRLEVVRSSPMVVDPLSPPDVDPVSPKTPEQQAYARKYFERWKAFPPPPYPRNEEEAETYNRLRAKWGFDLRAMKLPLPNERQEQYVTEYVAKWGGPPPPPYPRDEAEARDFDEYRAKWGTDPRILFDRGIPQASLWFHVSDPFWMNILQAGIIVVSVLFTIGLCTRLTSVLTWVAWLSYLHRAPTSLFGMDTMINIVLIYLMIGPSGAAVSLDRVLARWWAGARPQVLGCWRAFWDRLLGRHRPADDIVTPGIMPPAQPPPLVSANVAIRLLQVHTCIVYLAAGLAKLRGDTWWNGTAVWGSLANFEFAPMQYSLYVSFLRLLCKNLAVWQLFVTVGTGFTLVFEICYAFLIWRPATRWWILGMAIVLHGFIGMFMGLRTFALIMLVMNMAFLTPREAHWLAGWMLFPWKARLPGPAPVERLAVEAPEAAPVEVAATAIAPAGAAPFRRKR
jgi:hypothetical protein